MALRVVRYVEPASSGSSVNTVFYDDGSGNLSQGVYLLDPATPGTPIATLPVSLASVPSHNVTNAGTFATQATLAAETTKVIGTINLSAAQTLANVTTVGTITNVVHVDDNAGSLTVDNAGTFAVQLSQYTPVTGRLPVDGSGVTQPVSGSVSITGTVAATQSGTWNVGTVTTLTGITNVVHVDDNAGSLTIDAPVATPVFVRLSDGAAAISTLPVSIAASVAVTGAFWQSTQPVSNAGTFAVQATLAAETTKVIGTINLASAQTLATVTTVSTLTTITNAVTITPPTLTKATQGATGLSVQDLKDAGRAIVNAATAIAGVTAVTTEALLALNVSRDGAATSSVTTIAVTSGKRYRVTGILVGLISTAAAVLAGRISLRMNPAGAAVATSPIMLTISLSQQAAALAQAGDEMYVPIPDGMEFSGTQQIGLSQVCSAITGTIWASIIGYEY